MPDALFSTLLSSVLEAWGQTVGTCNVCKDGALPLPCVVCGEHTCPKHAWVSGEVVARRVPRVVCSKCIAALEVEEFDDTSPPPKVAKPTEQQRAWAFGVLGLRQGATQEQIKKAYRKKAKEFHPDKNPNGAADFKAVQEAYECLKV